MVPTRPPPAAHTPVCLSLSLCVSPWGHWCFGVGMGGGGALLMPQFPCSVLPGCRWGQGQLPSSGPVEAKGEQRGEQEPATPPHCQKILMRKKEDLGAKAARHGAEPAAPLLERAAEPRPRGRAGAPSLHAGVTVPPTAPRAPSRMWPLPAARDPPMQKQAHRDSRVWGAACQALQPRLCTPCSPRSAPAPAWQRPPQPQHSDRTQDGDKDRDGWGQGSAAHSGDMHVWGGAKTGARGGEAMLCIQREVTWGPACAHKA